MNRSRSRVSLMSKRDYSYRNNAFFLVSLQQCHLPARRAKHRTIQVKTLPAIEPQPLDRLAEALRQQISKRPLAAHAHTEAAVVHLTPTYLPHQAHHMGRTLRVMRRQPLLE